MPDIISQRQTYITVSRDDGLYPAEDLFPSEELYPKDAGTIDITNIVSGTLKLDTLIAENVPQFGRIFASKFECTAYLTGNIKNYKIQVTQTDGASSKVLFTGFIDSCKQDGTGLDRKIVAYDFAKRLKEINAATWWEWFWKNRTDATLKECRESFLDYIDIVYKDVDMPNDNLYVRKSVDLTNCTADTMLQMMCELNYCFPHFNGLGELEFIVLDTDFWEEPPIDLTGRYERTKSNFEEFKTDPITGMQFYDSGNELKYTFPDENSNSTKNAYPVRKNIFLYEADQTDLERIGYMFSIIFEGFSYTPSTVKMITSDLSIKLGDKIHTEKGDFYVLQNTLSGPQLFEQTLKCKGQEVLYGGKPNFNYSEVILGEKIARVVQTIDEFSVDYANFREGTEAKFRLTSDQISTEVSQRKAGENDLLSKYTQTAEAIRTEVVNRTDADNKLSSSITQTASAIRSEVTQTINGTNARVSTLEQTATQIQSKITDLSNEDKKLSSSITQTAAAIRSEVSSADKKLGDSISKVEQTANSITLEVSNGASSSSITLKRGNVSVVTKKIEFTGGVVFKSNLTDGTTKIDGGNIQSGKINAKYIDADNLTVKAAATITGTLKASQIVGEDLTINSTNGVSKILVKHNNQEIVNINENDGIVVGKSNISTQLTNDGVYIGTGYTKGTGKIALSAPSIGKAYIKMGYNKYNDTTNSLQIEYDNITLVKSTTVKTTISPGAITLTGNLSCKSLTVNGNSITGTKGKATLVSADTGKLSLKKVTTKKLPESTYYVINVTKGTPSLQVVSGSGKTAIYGISTGNTTKPTIVKLKLSTDSTIFGFTSSNTTDKVTATSVDVITG